MNRREYLYQRKNRCVGKIMQLLEEDVMDEVPDHIGEKIRAIVKHHISSYHNDVLEALEMERDTKINALAIGARR